MQCESAVGKRLEVWDDEWQDTIHTVSKDLWTATDRVTDDETDRVPLRGDERAVLQPLIDLGFEIVGTGLGRIVLRFPRESDHAEFVMKLGRYGDGLLEIGMYQNRVEVETWLEHGGPDSVLLGPVTWAESPNHCRWVIFPYGTPLPDTEFTGDSKKELVERVDLAVREHEYPLAAREITETNVVMVDGEARLADYGRSEDLERWYLG